MGDDPAKADENKPLVENNENQQQEKQRGPPNGTVECGCCIFECTPERTADLTCFCFIPIRCGVVLIGLFSITLLILLALDIGYGLLNEYIDWWYVLVGILLLAPLVVGVSFFVVFFASDNEDSRARLFVSCQLTIISVTLVAVWNLIYFHYYYKSDAVYTGTSDSGYIKQTKR